MTLSACILLSSPCHIWTVIRKNHLEFPQHSNQAQRGHTCNSAYLEPFDHLNENDHLFKVAKLMALVFIWSTDHAELWVTPQISLKQQERCLAGPWEPELNLTCLPPLEAWLDPRYLTMKLSPVKICDNHHMQGTEGQRLLCFRTSGPHTQHRAELVLLMFCLYGASTCAHLKWKHSIHALFLWCQVSGYVYVLKLIKTELSTTWKLSCLLLSEVGVWILGYTVKSVEKRVGKKLNNKTARIQLEKSHLEWIRVELIPSKLPTWSQGLKSSILTACS